MKKLDDDVIELGHLGSITFRRLVNPDTHPTAPVAEVSLRRTSPFDDPRLTRAGVRRLIVWLGSTIDDEVDVLITPKGWEHR